MAVAELLRPTAALPSDAQLLDCFEQAMRAADAAAQLAGKRLRRQQCLSPQLAEAPHGFADLLILGSSAELPALQRLGLIAPAGTGLWRVLGLSRHGGAGQPLAVAMASAQAAAQVLSSRLPRLCISTRSFGLP